jgi:hypothetical protein
MEIIWSFMDQFWGYVAMAIVQGLVTKVFRNKGPHKREKILDKIDGVVYNKSCQIQRQKPPTTPNHQPHKKQNLTQPDTPQKAANITFQLKRETL